MGITDGLKRVKRAWNLLDQVENFDGSPESYSNYTSYGAGYSVRPDRFRLTRSNDKTIISSIYNRIAIDVAAVSMKHVKVDQNGRYLEDIVSGLNTCLTLEANIDQAARHFRQDVVMTLFDKGVVALVPVDTDEDIRDSNTFDIKSMRVGEIVNWYPRHVRVSVYNDNNGLKQEVTLPKNKVAIIENPLYSVMNETNSTLQRLIRKLNLLDSIDEQAGSGKLDLIIQLPYVIKSEARRDQAEKRRKDIEVQLSGSKYGIAYTDGTERITQLNRPAENNMLATIETLTAQLYAQLGLTEDVFNGTADEKTMLNYHNRTIEPILTAITEAMKRSFLTKTARTQGQSIEFFRDPFKLIAIGDMAEIADKFIRNEIFAANDIRAIMGQRPSTDPNAEQLRNPNMPNPAGGVTASSAPDMGEQDKIMDDVFNSLESTIDGLLAEDDA